MGAFRLVTGLPGAGKTTFSNCFDNVLHYDDISKRTKAERNEIYAKTEAECIEGVFNSVKSRANILKLINRDHNVVYWIDTPLEVCAERDRTGGGLAYAHAKMFQPPTYSEGWDEIYIVRDGKEILMPREDEKCQK